MALACAQVCKAVKAAGMHCGIALKPATSPELVFPYVEAGLVDMVLILTVEPGFGGQKFMADKVSKVRTLRDKFSSLSIEVCVALPQVKCASSGILLRAWGREACSLSGTHFLFVLFPSLLVWMAGLLYSACSNHMKQGVVACVQVDGGLAPSTIDQAASAGANVIVAGTAIAGAADQAEAIRILRSSVDKWSMS
eukprot:79561-Pelagomonas_calceolata.AAC.5